MKKFDINNNICCDDIVKNIFDLNYLDLKIYRLLKKTNEIKVDELAKKINYERSTVYRSLQKLTNCKLCKKETKTISNGGYYHLYKYEESNNIKEMLNVCIESWYKKMKKTITNFE